MTRMWDMVGRKLGDYRLVEVIGAGAMGSVFRAENIHHLTLHGNQTRSLKDGQETFLEGENPTYWRLWLAK